MTQKIVAVLFGGKSAEHDISILTGLQVIEAMDTSLYHPIPVYVDQAGQWWSGEDLLDRKQYPLISGSNKKVFQVQLCTGQKSENPTLHVIRKGLLTTQKSISFDIAFLAFHGSLGEDGAMQGLFEIEGIPYTGCRIPASAIYMNKMLAKHIFKELGIPVLPSTIIRRPFDEGYMDIGKLTQEFDIHYPVCAKPCNLGSSIGVHKVNDQQELQSALLDIFKMDSEVIIEPFVENLIEYNVAVSKAFGEIRLSAIERPMRAGDLLNFKDKYLANGGLESKLSVPFSEGMASASRKINPKELTEKQKNLIEESAKKAFMIVSGCGAPRIDFLCDSKTGTLWLNEVNPFPGSAGYYLWEAASPKINFTKLLVALIEEAITEQKRSIRVIDPKLINASVF